MKICLKCNISKNLQEFSKDLRQSDGVRNTCKECRNKKLRNQNNQPINLINKICNKCNLEKDIINFHINKRHLDGYEKSCRECRQIKTKNNYIVNKEKIKERTLSYYYENKEKVYAARRIRAKERRKTDILWKLKRNLRNRLYYALKNKNWKKNTHFSEYIGCERAELISHIERQFQPGMTWDNYGEWEIDHIQALSNAVTEIELYKRCHYTNLQPLWKIENAKKSNS